MLEPLVTYRKVSKLSYSYFEHVYTSPTENSDGSHTKAKEEFNYLKGCLKVMNHGIQQGRHVILENRIGNIQMLPNYSLRLNIHLYTSKGICGVVTEEDYPTY